MEPAASRKHGGAPRIREPVIVTEAGGLDALLDSVATATAIGVDCEQNGLHAYRARVCLIQLSTERRDWIVDPLAEGVDVSRLAPVFADARRMKVFHAAEEDVIGLARDFSIVVDGLFDTMWAAKMLGWPRVGLAPILEARHGVRLDKRLQRHDWGRRPLSDEAVRYAQLDTHFLIELYREQEAELARRGRLEDAREIFAELAESRAIPPWREPWAYRLKGERELSDRGRAIAHSLVDARDAEAVRRDRPAFKIIGDKELLAIAMTRPANMDELHRVEGVSRRLLERHGSWLVTAVRAGLTRKAPPRPPKRARDDAAAARYQAMRAWRNAVASEHGVSGEVIVPNDALEAVARAVPSTLEALAELGVLGQRRLAAYGAGLIAAMAGASARAADRRGASDAVSDAQGRR